MPYKYKVLLLLWIMRFVFKAPRRNYFVVSRKRRSPDTASGVINLTPLPWSLLASWTEMKNWPTRDISIWNLCGFHKWAVRTPEQTADPNWNKIFLPWNSRSFVQEDITHIGVEQGALSEGDNKGYWVCPLPQGVTTFDINFVHVHFCFRCIFIG